MSATNAERQRRYRHHRAGDHSLCDPSRCDPNASVTPTVTSRVTGPRLASAGRQLWRELGGDAAEGGVRALIVEACRITDRLDKLDRFLGGEDPAWLQFQSDEDSGTVTVTIDRALAEARQQAAVLKQLLSEIRQSRGAGASSRPRQAATGAPAGKGGGVADLTARIAERAARTAG